MRGGDGVGETMSSTLSAACVSSHVASPPPSEIFLQNSTVEPIVSLESRLCDACHARDSSAQCIREEAWVSEHWSARLGWEAKSLVHQIGGHG